MVNLQEITQFYLEFLKRSNTKTHKDGTPREHAKWMLTEMVSFTDEMKEKHNRWLGFVQGVLWMERIFSIDELREHVVYYTKNPKYHEL
jgi:hypothetical protein